MQGWEDCCLWRPSIRSYWSSPAKAEDGRFKDMLVPTVFRLYVPDKNPPPLPCLIVDILIINPDESA